MQVSLKRGVYPMPPQPKGSATLLRSRSAQSDIGSSSAGVYQWFVSYLLIFIGGGIGAALRHGVNRTAITMLGPSYPWGTLFVNVVGGLLMGVLAELFLERGGISQEMRLFLTTGILGGFTTFSAFSLDAVVLWQRGEHAGLMLYVIGSVVASVGALFLGMSAARTFIS